jgi:hypothetical protein
MPLRAGFRAMREACADRSRGGTSGTPNRSSGSR